MDADEESSTQPSVEFKSTPPVVKQSKVLLPSTQLEPYSNQAIIKPLIIPAPSTTISGHSVAHTLAVAQTIEGNTAVLAIPVLAVPSSATVCSPVLPEILRDSSVTQPNREKKSKRKTQQHADSDFGSRRASAESGARDGAQCPKDEAEKDHCGDDDCRDNLRDADGDARSKQSKDAESRDSRNGKNHNNSEDIGPSAPYQDKCGMYDGVRGRGEGNDVGGRDGGVSEGEGSSRRSSDSSSRSGQWHRIRKHRRLNSAQGNQAIFPIVSSVCVHVRVCVSVSF